MYNTKPVSPKKKGDAAEFEGQGIEEDLSPDISPGLLHTGFTSVSTTALHMPSATALCSLGCPRHITNMPVESSVTSLVANDIYNASLREPVKSVSWRDGEEALESLMFYRVS